MTPEEILENGIANIEKYGFNKGDFGNKERGYCALGSMRCALANWDVYRQAARRLEKEIASWTREKHGPDVRPSVPAFNDDPETTKEDVILAMKRAANR